MSLTESTGFEGLADDRVVNLSEWNVYATYSGHTRWAITNEGRASLGLSAPQGCLDTDM